MMAAPINTTTDLQEMRVHTAQTIRLSKRLPEQVFSDRIHYFKFLTFDDFGVLPFPAFMADFLMAIGDEEYWLLCLDPDPEEYLQKHYDFLGAIKMSVEEAPENYFSMMSSFPRENSADSLMMRGDVIAISSPSCQWGIVFDRNSDLGVCGFSTAIWKNEFTKHYEVHFSGSQAIENASEACEYAYKSTRRFDDMYRLRANYLDVRG